MSGENQPVSWSWVVFWTMVLVAAIIVGVMNSSSCTNYYTDGGGPMDEERIEYRRTKSALIVVDVQSDFACPFGSLPVPGGKEVVLPLNQWIKNSGMWKVETQDWHQAGHCSFEEQGGKFPPHCIAGSPGAELHGALEDIPDRARKGILRDEEGLSALDSSVVVHGSGVSLVDELRSRSITRLYVGGLATEYCVAETVLDALEIGFDVSLILDAIRPIDEEAGDDALHRMYNRGLLDSNGNIEFVRTSDFYGKESTW